MDPCHVVAMNRHGPGPSRLSHILKATGWVLKKTTRGEVAVTFHRDDGTDTMMNIEKVEAHFLGGFCLR